MDQKLSELNQPLDQSSISLDEWQAEAPKVSIDLAAFDALIQDWHTKRKDYEAKKKIANESYETCEEAETKVLQALKAAGKSKYHVDGVGTVYTITKEVVRVPKTIEQKQALFKFVREKYGNDLLMNLLTINHQSLNGFYNQEAERAREQGIATLLMPGLDQPQVEEGVGFRKSK